MGDLLFEWLWMNNVYIGKKGTDFALDYNDFHNFYDLHLFEIPGNVGNPKGHWEKTIEFLENDGYEVKVSYDSWRNTPEGKIDGVRLWIKPIDEPSVSNLAGGRDERASA